MCYYLPINWIVFNYNFKINLNKFEYCKCSNCWQNINRSCLLIYFKRLILPLIDYLCLHYFTSIKVMSFSQKFKNRFEYANLNYMVILNFDLVRLSRLNCVPYSNGCVNLIETLHSAKGFQHWLSKQQIFAELISLNYSFDFKL